MDHLNKLMAKGLGIRETLESVREPMTAALKTRGWYTMDNFLGERDCRIARAEAVRMRLDGKFSQSYSEVAETREKIWRPDVHAMELDGDSWRMAPLLITYVSELMREMPPLMNECFDQLGLESGVFGHKLAVSLGNGSHYPKHLDNVSGPPSDTRKLTAIYYMNHGWDDANGGALRLYDQIEEPTFHDIPPSGDRLVLFWSDLIVHDVLPSWDSDEEAHRYTFTVWLSTQNMRVLLDETSPLHEVRQAHFPTR